MKLFLQNLLSLVLPITVLVIVPWLIEQDISIKNVYAFIAGMILMVAGLYVMIRTIASIIRIGQGTLAPWSPTKKLVVTGLYLYVRNPMILGVLMVLISESVAILSWKIFVWAIAFFVINTLFFILYEEPNLEKRFGDEYREYKKNVGRWVPRVRR